jgi:hypothetical protein
MRWATRYLVPVVPRGAGSGLSGGATAIDGCIVLSLEKMRALTIDPGSRTARAQPGQLNVVLEVGVEGLAKVAAPAVGGDAAGDRQAGGHRGRGLDHGLVARAVVGAGGEAGGDDQAVLAGDVLGVTERAWAIVESFLTGLNDNR